MKRALDIGLLAVTAPLWLPLALAVAAAVFLALGRPVFFRQERAGLHGRPFRLVKFRTMRTGAGTDAERLTRFGRLLRATSLDELPELWHVLKGEMSLVGPRPLPVEYLPRYSAEQFRRHETLPGLTGLAQIRGRNLLGWEERFRHDVEYVDTRTVWLDLKIIGKTLLQLAAPRGISHPGEATMGEFKGGADSVRRG